MEWINRFSTVMDNLSRASSEGIGISQLSRESGLSKSTLHRMLRSMLSHNLVYQHEHTKNYYLGPRAMYWGSEFLQNQDPGGMMREYCEEVSVNTGLYGYLSKFQGNEVYCIYSYQPSDLRNTYFVSVGQRMPLHCSSSAKVILAYMEKELLIDSLGNEPFKRFTKNTIQNYERLKSELQKVKEEQIGYCFEELESGVSAISTPIFYDEAHTNMSLSLVGESNMISANIEKLQKELLTVAEKASHHLQSIATLSTVRLQ